MNVISNSELSLAFDYVSETDRNIFLTGKAGTGKTTFLHRVKKEVKKRMAIVAPTGVAAINAKGVTIHSLFQLPFGPLTPEKMQGEVRHKNFTKKKKNLIKSLDLLIIDEISMVRADVLDAIDVVLRRYRNFRRPFGGVQLLMIGDLHQLPPVVRPEAWDLLSPYYQTAYFFGSRALQETNAITIELKHIFRQADRQFIDLLNRVRNNQIDATALSLLNQRYQPNFKPHDNEGYITLTSHNSTAQFINDEKLKELPGEIHSFDAKVEGDFPASIYPTALKLNFKLNAQVMFIKNDPDPSKRFYNGKIGYITKFEKGAIFVKCPGEEAISVSPLEWQNIKYSLDESTKQVTEEVKGKFIQYPLKLAWAITIHKSQGLTFEKVIIDAHAAFAHGQVYVALSRCKTFEGIVLRTPIIEQSVKTDVVVRDYTEEAERNAPGLKQLQQAKREYQQNLIKELFDFRPQAHKFDQLRRALLENDASIQGEAATELEQLIAEAGTKVFAMANKFLPQLTAYFNDSLMPENHEVLQSRIQKASTYFIPVLKDGLYAGVLNLDFHTDNKAVRKTVHDKWEELKLSLFIKQACFDACKEGFAGQTYIQARANAEIDYQIKQPAAPQALREKIPKEVIHQALYEQLKTWRDEKAQSDRVGSHSVFPTKTLMDMTHVLPTKTTTLKKMKGVGKTRIEKYGDGVLDIIVNYTKARGIKTDQLQFITGKDPDAGKPKKDTKAISLEMFVSGKTIAEIAIERTFAISTIEGHLAYFVGTGELDINKFLSPEQVKELTDYFEGKEKGELSSAKEYFGNKYSYGQLKMIRNYVERREKE